MIVEKLRQRKFSNRNKAKFRNLNGDELGPYRIKILDFVEGDKYSRLFECPVCTRPFVAQVSNIMYGTVRHCDCFPLKVLGYALFKY